MGQSDVYLVGVGVSRYAQESMNLQFAAKDAVAVATLFRDRGSLQYRQVHTREILDEEATKAGIIAALTDAAEAAQPDDMLAIFLAGHGVMVGQRYYFIPHEFHRQAETLEEDIRQQGLPADELGDALANAAARKRLLIFDTCASGGALGVSRKGRDPYAFRGAIERVGRREGVFTIAASSAGEEAQEIDELGHGVLTYALLAGLKAVPPGGPLEGLAIQPTNPDGLADVLEWFSFASGHVPRLSKRFLRREQDVQIGGQGASFLVLPLSE
jgi:uncharacterized caspase-like protein